VEIKCQLDATDEFLLQILLLAQHALGTIMTIIRSSRVLYKWLLSVVFGAWFSSYRYGVELRVVCSVCGPHTNDQHDSFFKETWSFRISVDTVTGISGEVHRQIPVGSNNAIMISANYVTGNSSWYFMGPSDTIWPRTVFCHVQVLCRFRFVHRGLLPKTVLLTFSVFPTYLISWHVGKHFQ
jgi:hypothetical protein